MAIKAWMALLLAAVAALPPAAWAQPRETAGVVTEIRPGKGKAEVRAAGSGDWKPAGPLQALRAGDEVRATENAAVVVLLTGGRGSMRVEAKSSPFVVVGPAADDSKMQKARALVAGSLGYLAGATKEAPTAVLSTRAGSRPPVILSPRAGLVLPDSLLVEWVGTRTGRYTVRILGPSGPVLERAGVPGPRFAYPADAPRLSPGVRYTIEVVTVGHPAHQAQFELMDAARAEGVRQDLKQLEEALGPGVSPTSLTVMRAGFLAQARLLHDARLAVLAALVKDPEEPTLHTLLGDLYMQTGLLPQAAESFEEARYLLTR